MRDEIERMMIDDDNTFPYIKMPTDACGLQKGKFVSGERGGATIGRMRHDDAVADGCIRPRSSDRKRKAKSFGAGMVRYHDD